MASHRVSIRQLNGEAMVLDIMPEITGRELKERIKECLPWDDELTRKTTRVDIVVGESKLLTNAETAADAGLSPESEVTVILRQNTVTCSHKDELFAQCGQEIDFESFYIVQIPSGATQIVPHAFASCSSLASVTIPNSVTQIGKGAFAECSSLVRVTIPDSVARIEYGAFEGCSSLASVTIPRSVTQIGAGAFAFCSSLASVTIPNSVTQIGNGVFAKCSSLASVTIPDSVTQIGNGAFAQCRSLVRVTIPDSVTQIGLGAFIGCSSLASLTIPDSVSQIGMDPFLGCSALTLVVPVTRWKKSTFEGCKRILAKECECRQCNYRWFLNGWVCPRQRRSSHQCRHGRH